METDLDRHEVSRVEWSDIRLWRAESKRQSSAPRGGIGSSFEPKDLVVGVRVWGVEVHELKLKDEVKDGCRWVEPAAVTNSVLKVVGKLVGPREEEQLYTVRQVWRSDGLACNELTVSYEHLCELAFWSESRMDSDEYFWRVDLEALERNYGLPGKMWAEDFGELDWISD